ncbi:hypothetical protein [Pyruvatibacter mobilis]|uniref:hypothetical protein n=1 Tax=Pyruvatibacter mobilis TaxID=1712261 RepID=UPI003BA8B9EF
MEMILLAALVIVWVLGGIAIHDFLDRAPGGRTCWYWWIVVLWPLTIVLAAAEKAMDEVRGSYH